MNLANRITVLRLAMIPIFIACVYNYSLEREWLRFVALGVYGLAALSDIVDGQIARRLNQRSRLGARLDPFADKLINNLGFVFLAANNQFDPGVPMWFPVIILTRDVVIVMGAYLLNKRYGPLAVIPRNAGKLTTMFQMSAVIGVLLQVFFAPYLLLATVLLTVYSMLDYLFWGYRQAARRNPA